MINPVELIVSRSWPQRQTQSWAAHGRKKIRGHSVQRCRQPGTDLPWSHAKCHSYAKNTLLLWNAGVCHSSPLADSVCAPLQVSAFLRDMDCHLRTSSSLAVKRGSHYCLPLWIALRFAEAKRQLDISIIFIIIMNYSACITIYDSMILWSPWEAPGIVLVLFVQSGLVQLPGVWQSREVHGFLTIIHLGDRSFSASSLFFFYLTAWWASTSPNFLFLGAMK